MSFCHCLVARAKNCDFNQRAFRFILKPKYFQGELYQFLCTITLTVFTTVSFLIVIQFAKKLPAFLQRQISSSSSLHSATGPKAKSRDSTSFPFLYITFQCYTLAYKQIFLKVSFFSVRKVGIKLSIPCS